MPRTLTPRILARRNTHFYIWYFVILWVVILLGVGGWFWLHGRLADYEAAQPGTVAGSIATGISQGNLTPLSGVLSPEGEDALLTYAKNAPGETYTVRQAGGSGYECQYRVTASGIVLLDFTLYDDPDTEKADWRVTEATASDAALNGFSESLALEQIDLVVQRMSDADYGELYGVLTHTGFVEDDYERFSDFITANTPGGDAFTWDRNDADGKRGYDVLASDQLFAHVSMLPDGPYGWKVESLTLSGALTTAYINQLADLRAADILALFSGGNTDPLYACCVANGYPDGAAEEFGEFFREIAQGHTFSCSIYPSSNDQVRNYQIDGGDVRFADFTLSQTKSGDGLCWAVTGFSLPVWVPYQATVTAPASAVVYVNGKALDQSSVLSSEIPEDADSRVAEKCPEQATVLTYKVQGAFDQPSLYAVDWEGNLMPLSETGTDAFAFTPHYADAQMEGEMHEFLSDFCETLGYLCMADLHMNSMPGYVERNSPAWVWLANYDNHWIKVHNKNLNKFYDFSATNFVRYSDTMFSCDVSFTLSVVYRNSDGTPVEYKPAYRLYLEKIDGNWKIYSFINTVE